MIAVALHKKHSIRALVTVMVACCILAALGTWQIQRLAWKYDLIATLQERMAQPPVALADLPRPLAAQEWRPVQVQGHYDHTAGVLVGPRTLKGQVGRHVFTPLVMADGRRIMINRGFVPMDTSLDVMPYTQPEGMIEVEGLVRLPARGTFTPDNAPTRGAWYWPDIAAMVPQAGSVTEIYIQQSPFTGADWPHAVVVSPDLPNNHAQYAVFWFGMAVIAVLVYLIARRKGYA